MLNNSSYLRSAGVSNAARSAALSASHLSWAGGARTSSLTKTAALAGSWATRLLNLVSSSVIDWDTRALMAAIHQSSGSCGQNEGTF